MGFSTISSIDLANPDSWREPVFLTVDIDWAVDEVIHDTADLIEQAGAAATWFVTHDTPVIKRLRANPRWEIGAHPNFNFLINCDPQMGASVDEVIHGVLKFAPGATAVRSHALVQGTQIHKAFAAHGFTHECNDLIHDVEITPWMTSQGLTKAPHFWEDDVCFTMATRPCVRQLAKRSGLKVFDFHPIHVCFNSANGADYEEARPHSKNYEALVSKRRSGNDGSRAALITLLETVQ